MRRIPSIHILETDLIDVFREVFNSIDPFDAVEDPDYYPVKVARKILEAAKTKSIPRRSILASNKKVMEKANKIKLSGRSEAGMFAELLLLTRRKMHHKGIRLIDPSSSDWPTLKEVCSLATEFCNEFGISLKEGYLKYLSIGVHKMKNFTMYKFKSVHAAICKHYECSIEIEEDKTPDKTHLLYNLYLKQVNEKLGWEHNDYKDNPEKYVCFVRAKVLAEKFKIDVRDYVKAQFFAFEWGERTIIPDPLQLYGDKAIERVRKYAYEHNIAIRKPKTIDFKKLRNG